MDRLIDTGGSDQFKAAAGKVLKVLQTTKEGSSWIGKGQLAQLGLITRETTRCRLGAKAISYIGYWYDRDNSKECKAIKDVGYQKE